MTTLNDYLKQCVAGNLVQVPAETLGAMISVIEAAPYIRKVLGQQGIHGNTCWAQPPICECGLESSKKIYDAAINQLKKVLA